MDPASSTRTTHFASALTSWFEANKQVSLRQIAIAADIFNLHQFRSGVRAITFDAITKLLPAIEANSTRSAAVTLLIAYLHDETPPNYQPAVRIDVIDPQGATTLDIYQLLAKDWETRSRTQSDFFAMWLGLDSFMHHPEHLTGTTPETPPEVPTEPKKLLYYTPDPPVHDFKVAEDPVNRAIAQISAQIQHPTDPGQGKKA